MFSVGDTVGEYEIVAKLRSGGMATLFLGRRQGAEGFSRYVAIKVVHEHLATDPMFVQMFVDEALLSAKIQHPNVVHVEALGELEGRHFLVMEYVHGCPLSTLMSQLRKRGRTLSPELATYVAVKVAEGLHAAHDTTAADGQSLGVVHRDVTPQNVLLAYRGHVKLIDFGVAKARGRAQQTTGGSLKGKIGYMSPEQAFGRAVDRRTDVYALGIVLWEMLTGTRAFTADNDFALLERVRDPKLAPASTFNPAIPPALDAVIARATAKDAEARFDTAQQMRKALAQAVPSALALDASDLEKLLSATLGDEMESDRRALPDSVSGLVSTALALKGPDAEEVVATLTVSAAGIADGLASMEASRPSAAPSQPGERRAASGTLVLPDEVEPEVAPPAPRRLLPIVAAVIAGALLVGVGTGVAILHMSSEPEGIRATELPRDTIPAAVPPREAEVPERPAEAVPAAEPPAIPEPSVASPADEPAHEETASAEADDDHEAQNEAHEDEGPATSDPEPPAPRRATSRPRRPARPRAERHRSTGGAVPLADEF